MERPRRVLETYRRSLRPFLPQIPTNAATHWVHILEYGSGGSFISWSKVMKCIVKFHFCVCCILWAELVIWNTISVSCQKWRRFCLVLHFCVNYLHGIRHTTSAFGSLHIAHVFVCFKLYLSVFQSVFVCMVHASRSRIRHTTSVSGAQWRAV